MCVCEREVSEPNYFVKEIFVVFLLKLNNQIIVSNNGIHVTQITTHG